ncbi:MAG TPA: Rieske 2Fe-2S domain-containing protein [Gemmatimonadaceae bacterium]|nr:Rieske 2Fe-2S domain-containing protein [Gemmatimonadaceae bacterium]
MSGVQGGSGWHMAGGAPPDERGFELVARTEDVPEGALLGVVTSTGERICLINCNGELYAVRNNCTHQDFPMEDGVLLSDDGCTIECAWHGARFDCATGAVKRWPAEDPLPVYELRVEDGGIYVGARKP